jgi:hypothetical protein
MIRLELLGADTHLHSTLCARCPQGPAGCCKAPPEMDWSDIGRVVARGGRDFVLEHIAARRLLPTARGLALARVRKREHPGDPRQSKCVFHGAEGCTIAPARRPATCNYFLCEDAFVASGERRGNAEALSSRVAHGRLRFLYDRWDEALSAQIRQQWPEGPPWDAAFLDWLGTEFARLGSEDRARIASLMP